MTFSTFDVYKDDEEFLAFLFFFQNVRHRIPTSVTEGISFGHCRYFHAWPTPQFAHNDSLHWSWNWKISTSINEMDEMVVLPVVFFDIFSEVSSLEVVSFWELQWVQTPVSCSGSDGAFMKNMRHDLDGSMRPPNPVWRNQLSGETTLTLWKVT